MKAKETIALLLSLHVNTELSSEERKLHIDQVRNDLIEKCDSLLKAKGSYPSDVFTSTFFADPFKLADEPWRAVLHGLRNKGVDPAEFDLYEGGFLVHYIRQQLLTTTKALNDRKVDNNEYAYQLRCKLDYLVGMMQKHGWEDTLSKMPMMRDQLLEIYAQIDYKLHSNIVEMVKLCEELVDLRNMGSQLSGKQHDRMTGVDRYVKNNRQNVEVAIGMLSESSTLKQQEQEIRTLIADASRQVDIPRPEKKVYEPKPKQEHTKHKGNSKSHSKGSHKPNQSKPQDFCAAPTLSPAPKLADDDDTVPNVENRSRSVSEIFAPA